MTSMRRKTPRKIQLRTPKRAKHEAEHATDIADLGSLGKGDIVSAYPYAGNTRPYIVRISVDSAIA
jgi:hypothetical protein